MRHCVRVNVSLDSRQYMVEACEAVPILKPSLSSWHWCLRWIRL